jgi:hypothetical protein
MYSFLAPERLDKFYSYSVFKNVSIMGWCPENMNISAPKIGALTVAPESKVAIFSKTAFKIFIKYQ